jgi:hypothetical protein
MIIAARPSAELDIKTGAVKSIRHVRILPLAVAKLARYLEDLCKAANISLRLIEDVKRSQLFKQLPQSPIAAILLSKLLTADRQDLPSSMTELYSQSMELMLGRWDIQKGLQTQKEYAAITAVMGRLARFVLDNGLDAISMDEARANFSSYLAERNLELKAEDLLERVCERSGVLATDLTQGVVRFRHRSFAEYLYALEQKEGGGQEIDGSFFDVYWQNCRFFYVGLRKDCPELLKDILAWPPSSLGERWVKLLNAPNYLLAGVTTPYRITEEYLYKLMLEAGNLYIDIRNGALTQGLAKLSEGQLLWLFQYLIRQSYSFRYFAKALESSVLRILDDNADSEVKAYALLFLSLVGLDLDEPDAMDLLLKDFGVANLPLAASWAAKCEIESYKAGQKSPLMKKHQKKLKRLAKAEQAIAQELRDIFEVPLERRQKTLTRRKAL